MWGKALVTALVLLLVRVLACGDDTEQKTRTRTRGRAVTRRKGNSVGCIGTI